MVFFAFSISPAFNFSIDVNERFVVTSQYRAFCVRRDLSCRDFFEVFSLFFLFQTLILVFFLQAENLLLDSDGNVKLAG